MKLVEQLAVYYRLSHHAEVKSRWCQWWLPQGDARVAYLRELLDPVASTAPNQVSRLRVKDVG